MIRKLLTALLAALAFYVLPAVPRPEALRHPQLWILVAVAVAISIFQPAYKPVDKSAPPHDRHTASQIVWSVYLTQLVGIIEAIYFRYPDSFRWDVVTTLSLVAMVAGLGLRIWAVLTLGRFFTWFITVYDDHQVIRSGPFRFIRHPASIYEVTGNRCFRIVYKCGLIIDGADHLNVLWSFRNYQCIPFFQKKI